MIGRRFGIASYINPGSSLVKPTITISENINPNSKPKDIDWQGERPKTTQVGTHPGINNINIINQNIY